MIGSRESCSSCSSGSPDGSSPFTGVRQQRQPSAYPACSAIVKNLGTCEEAECADGDDVIEVQDYYMWDTYHPYGDAYTD